MIADTHHGEGKAGGREQSEGHEMEEGETDPNVN